MNQFQKKPLKKITSTSKFEKNEATLLKDMQRYFEISRSAELEEYKSLFHTISSSEFQEKKKLLKNRKYQDTEEYQIVTQYRKLQKSSAIRLYYETLQSPLLQEYLQFKKTSEYEDLGDKKKVNASKTLQKFKEFEHSKAYKNYIRFHDSYIIKQYEELKEKVNLPEFKESNEFWANANRWHTTPEYALQQRYHQLRKNPDIIYYENEKPERFEKYQNLELTFEENFDWHTLDRSRWSYGFHYQHPVLIQDHSFANEKQAYNKGKNVVVENGILKIYTKKEKVTTRAWDPVKGFILKDFEYTSDIIQTADFFRQQRGVFRAKLRCSGKIHHAFWLGTDRKLPQITIFHFDGKNINVGNAHESGFDGNKIKGIHPSQFYIYTLVWTDNELIWFINDREVYRTSSNLPQEKMYLAFNSFIPEKEKGDEGILEVDWVKVYQFKKE